MKFPRLTGLVAAPFTPFHSDFSLNLDVVPRIAEHLVRQKVAGAFIGGTTGESASLTRDERIALAVAWRRAAGSELKLIVHVGSNCLADCQDLARHAASIGADAIGSIMPSFFRPGSLDAAVDFCRRIAEAAPSTPFYYYHMPDMTRVDLSMAEFVPAAAEAIPSFQGVKFTHSNLFDYSLAVAAAGDRHDILFGRDEYLLAGLAMGAKGAVGSTYNYSARLYHQMMRAHAEGHREEARKQQVYIQQSVLPLLKYGGLVAGKAVMAMAAGIDCGPVRPPLRALSEAKVATMKSELDAIDFFREVKV